MLTPRDVTPDEQYADDSALLAQFLDWARDVDADELLELARSVAADGDEAGLSKLVRSGARVYIERNREEAR